MTNDQRLTPRIPVRSRRQAMDWSLVLISQGIEAIIEYGDEKGEWRLVVPQKDYTGALRALRQYRVENRGWPWRWASHVGGAVGPALKFDWTSLAWVIL